LQAIGAGQPQYVLTAQSGPDHQKRFRVEVRIEQSGGTSRALAESEGTTKKQAQQEAARIAFERLLLEESQQESQQEPRKESNVGKARSNRRLLPIEKGEEAQR